jgi:2-hydroxy-3-keto-5-methylthiopentenyl-1-phosphate phosphatase
MHGTLAVPKTSYLPTRSDLATKKRKIICFSVDDKAQSINEYQAIANEESAEDEIPLIVFIGDDMSDLPAAREADVLFGRKGLRLEDYCIENKIAYWL